jgi:hypothetical protein
MRESIVEQFEAPNRLFIQQGIWLMLAASIIGLHIGLLIYCIPQLKKERGLLALIWLSVCLSIPVFGSVFYRVMRETRAS